MQASGLMSRHELDLVLLRLPFFLSNLVQKTSVLRTPKPGSPKSVCMRVSGGNFGEVFLTVQSC